MSVQIRIPAAAMLSAGWVRTLVDVPEYVYPDDHTGDPVYVPGDTYPVWEKDGVALRSLFTVNGDFLADCRDGGHNRRLFQRLGLLKLPHSFE